MKIAWFAALLSAAAIVTAVFIIGLDHTVGVALLAIGAALLTLPVRQLFRTRSRA
ncbi:hypothetical protein NWP10_06985 [Micrococcus sp. HG099]|uniref:hypothetical protein n=1 Tax=Micrococcus sp. HG099 TaxID=2969755 RepID=UPI00215A964F|nr:hypothetical protein [Micrococcus sp. HG099]MCR8675546.1 hypothetical protein [Micrococcus sp. HG099]